VKTTPIIKRFVQALTVLALAAIFVSLGLWQLDRARELQASKNTAPVSDMRVYELPDLTTPDGALPVEAFGKFVSATGHYIANFKAPNQVDSSGTTADWEVALMQVDTSSAILVVRGLWKDRFASPDIVMATQVTISGTIYPHQVQDRAENTSSQISRLDSSLLTSVTDMQLYDGFISANSESYRGGQVDRPRLTMTISTGGIPGYYWQHISYVVIWWLMAALVIWAPFYRRRGDLSVLKD
jgi:surfeit locus 1 family protein